MFFQDTTSAVQGIIGQKMRRDIGGGGGGGAEYWCMPKDIPPPRVPFTTPKFMDMDITSYPWRGGFQQTDGRRLSCRLSLPPIATAINL